MNDDEGPRIYHASNHLTSTIKATVLIHQGLYLEMLVISELVGRL